MIIFLVFFITQQKDEKMCRLASLYTYYLTGLKKFFSGEREYQVPIKRQDDVI